MTIQQIRYAMKIAETGSVNRAARTLGVKQPSVSAAIADLERELGICLFERNPRGMKLTDAGKEFLNYAKRLAQSFDQLEDRYGISDCCHKSVST